MDKDLEYMRIAYNEALKALKLDEVPIGAIIVKDAEVIGRSDDDTLISKTMYTHAELMAIESACKDHPNLYGELKGTTMYVSCEPCMMCMGAILYEEISRIVYATTIEDSNQYICKEVICDVNELAKCAKSNICFLYNI